MSEPARARRPLKQGYFTVPENPVEPPKLLGTVCKDCGEYFFPRRAVCAKCLSENTADAMLGPQGTLYSYTFVHIPLFGSTNIEHMEGYGVGQIDLPEGPRIQAPLAGKQAEFRIGQQLVAELDTLCEDGGRDLVIVRFRPLEAAR